MLIPMTRRELAAFLVAAPALRPAEAAQATSAAEPAQDDRVAEMKKDIRDAIAQLAKTKLDIATEPAFRFKA
jgi:hypothetical protein